MNSRSIIRFRNLAVLAGAGVVAFIGLQFIRPPLTNPPVTANLRAPAEVEHILRTSCYNCHSNETRLAWFDEVVPAYWLVASHVTTARRHVNFSDLGSQPVAQQKGVLFEAVNQVQLGAMPPASYRLAHPEAQLSPAQLVVLKRYLKSLESRQASGPEAVAAADGQYVQALATGALVAKVQPAPNGIEFPAGYRNWKVISSTDREDNHTLRQVLGNDVAIGAIATGQINPWPDGTIFAKVAWDQLIDAQGTARTGEFKQVEFMIKDSRKYAATKGWGWARWLGIDLHPFGQTSDFTASCVSCHKPVHERDFVFTAPLKTQP